MKLKTNSNRFRSPTLILIIAAIVSISTAGWFVWYNTQTHSVDYETGGVTVKFIDGTTSYQAEEFIKSYGLSVLFSQPSMKEIFEPSVITGVRQDDATTITDKLKGNPAIASITDGYPANVYSESYSFTINFNEGTTADEINQILASFPSFYFSHGDKFESLLLVDVKVPPGQESAYVDLFKQNPIVQTAHKWQQIILQ